MYFGHELISSLNSDYLEFRPKCGWYFWPFLNFGDSYKTLILTVGTRVSLRDSDRLRQPMNKVNVSMDGFFLEESPEQCETLLGCLMDAWSCTTA